MRRWRYKVRLIDIWNCAKKGELTAAQVGLAVARRIKSTLPALEYRHDVRGGELAHILNNLESLHSQATLDEFDDILDDLYDWANWEQKCWIQTR